MQKFFSSALGATCAGIAAVSTLISGIDAAVAGGKGGSSHQSRGVSFSTTHNSVIRIGAREALPQRRIITVGTNKTVLVELPVELRDVVVSDPEKLDAMVHSSNRVYLIGKKNGAANAFFFDGNGQQILILEVRVEQDTGTLDALLHKLLPGSSIKTEILNDTLILTGSVRSPVDANRAMDIASRFAVANAGGGGREKGKVINMLSVEGDDQVMLRVVIAEVNRSVLKQLGVNLGAGFGSGNMAVQALTENSLPVTSALGLGQLPMAAFSTGENTGCAAGSLCLFNGSKAQGTTSAFGNSGVTSFYSNGSTRLTQALRVMEREGPREDAGGAQPHDGFRRDGEVHRWR